MTGWRPRARWGRKATETAAGDKTAEPSAPARPDRLTYVVGDIHGRSDLLDAMLALIAADAGDRPHDRVFLGDYVDRGPDSAGVLRRLAALDRAGPSVTCLLGNHDRMLLDFLTDPPGNGAFWMRVGGEATLAGFGVPLSAPAAPPPDAQDVGPDSATRAAARHAERGARLATALGRDLRDWLAARPLWWRSGTLVAVHALTDPARPMEAQPEEVLLWARPDADLAPRADGSWVVHGHTVVPEPVIRRGHIAVDTGAFRSGRLTALVAAPDAPPRFLQTGPAGGAG